MEIEVLQTGRGPYKRSPGRDQKVAEEFHMVGAGDASYENRMPVRADVLGTSRPGDRAYENRMLVRADAPGPFAAWRPLLRHTRIRGSGNGMMRSRAIGAMQRPCRAPGRGGCAALIHPTDSRLHLVFRCGSGRGLFLEHHDVAPAAAADLEGEF